MDTGRKHTPLWLLPQPIGLPALRRRHPVISYFVNAVLLLALIPVYMFAAPTSTWEPTETFVILLSAGFVSAAAALDFRKYILIDAGSAIALVSVALLGPLPAVCAYAAGEAIYLFREYRPGRQPLALISNLVLIGLSTLAATAPFVALNQSPPTDNGIVAAALVAVGGCLMLIPNWMVLMFNGTFHDGQNLFSLARTAMDNFFADGFLIAGSVATVLIYGAIGTPALVLLIPLILVPRLTAPIMYRSQPISNLNQSEAASRYAELMARELGVTRDMQTIMLDAAAQLGGQAQLQAVENFQEVMQLVLYSNERWDGGEGAFPGVLSGKDIPLESRILAVAKHWASLTARGTQELSPQQAVQSLRAGASCEFDPTVVAAGIKLIEDELLPGTFLHEVVTRRHALDLGGT